ncbi:hypothetical protein TRICHSKD4_6075 [Roseibium sp. TrichSKD4]|uniref:hypothetical protein n=1 Tax=Roseibium sp. TrichSKD4 TaxID=744980 RepID=UPI0001E57131|nr:hypothetical protein [Roseibium sp. TrichSKD4]EFO28699.1 hypothetical protein TRICHSKD4_6075 [Roseibium sp. TrichSKD4]
MRIITGFINVFLGFMIMMFGIVLGFTIIGLLFAFPVTTAGIAKMTQGMAQIGFGTYETARKVRERQ